MLGRHTTLVGRILAAVALFTLLTGASEEYGGVVVSVELERTEHPAPEGHDSWEGVLVSGETGARYYWDPSGWVLVQRTDGSVVRARNDFSSVENDTRVSLLQSRTGGWFVTAVERSADDGGLYAPTEQGPMGPDDTQVTEAGTEQVWAYEPDGS